MNKKQARAEAHRIAAMIIRDACMSVDTGSFGLDKMGDKDRDRVLTALRDIGEELLEKGRAAQPRPKLPIVLNDDQGAIINRLLDLYGYNGPKYTPDNQRFLECVCHYGTWPIGLYRPDKDLERLLLKVLNAE